MKTKKCSICGTDGLQKIVSTEKFEYKGQEILIPDYVSYECHECGESIVDLEALKKSGKLLKDFKI